MYKREVDQIIYTFSFPPLREILVITQQKTRPIKVRVFCVNTSQDAYVKKLSRSFLPI